MMRGFALIGVLLVNLRFISSPQLYWNHADVTRRWPGFVHRITEWFIQIFIVAKFLSLFSFMFGLGFALLMKRAVAKDAPFGLFYSRRLLALLGFGLLHSFLLWYGDILTTYALLGFALVLFRRCSERSLLAWAAVLLLIPALLTLAPSAGGSNAKTDSGEVAGAAALAEQSIAAYRSSDFKQIFEQRVTDLTHAYQQTLPFLPLNFAMFLLGLYAGRRGVLQAIPEHLRLLRRLRNWGFTAGVAANAAALAILREIVPAPSSIGVLAFTVGAPTLGLSYGATLVILAQKPRHRRWLKPFAAVGRMALTNYMAQSAIATSLFYGYGLGLYAVWGPAADVPLAAMIFAAEMAFSVWWLRRYRFGPLEWIWRSLTYQRRQPFRIGS